MTGSACSNKTPPDKRLQMRAADAVNCGTLFLLSACGEKVASERSEGVG
jgi:hypothetical protein